MSYSYSILHPPSSVRSTPYIDRIMSDWWGPFLSGLSSLYKGAQAHLNRITE